jgi:hypothetical protein
MGRFVTARGVEVQTSDAAARAVGYTPVAEPEAEKPKKKAPAKKSASSKSSK